MFFNAFSSKYCKAFGTVYTDSDLEMILVADNTLYRSDFSAIESLGSEKRILRMNINHNMRTWYDGGTKISGFSEIYLTGTRDVQVEIPSADKAVISTEGGVSSNINAKDIRVQAEFIRDSMFSGKGILEIKTREINKVKVTDFEKVEIDTYRIENIIIQDVGTVTIHANQSQDGQIIRAKEVILDVTCTNLTITDSPYLKVINGGRLYRCSITGATRIELSSDLDYDSLAINGNSPSSGSGSGSLNILGTKINGLNVKGYRTINIDAEEVGVVLNGISNVFISAGKLNRYESNGVANTVLTAKKPWTACTLKGSGQLTIKEGTFGIIVSRGFRTVVVDKGANITTLELYVTRHLETKPGSHLERIDIHTEEFSFYCGDSDYHEIVNYDAYRIRVYSWQNNIILGEICNYMGDVTLWLIGEPGIGTEARPFIIKNMKSCAGVYLEGLHSYNEIYLMILGNTEFMVRVIERCEAKLIHIEADRLIFRETFEAGNASIFIKMNKNIVKGESGYLTKPNIICYELTVEQHTKEYTPDNLYVEAIKVHFIGSKDLYSNIIWIRERKADRNWNTGALVGLTNSRSSAGRNRGTNLISVAVIGGIQPGYDSFLKELSGSTGILSSFLLKSQDERLASCSKDKNSEMQKIRKLEKKYGLDSFEKSQATARYNYQSISGISMEDAKTYITALYHIGLLYVLDGRSEDARSLFTICEEFMQDEETILLVLGLLYCSDGNPDLGREYLDMYLGYASDDSKEVEEDGTDRKDALYDTSYDASYAGGLMLAITLLKLNQSDDSADYYEERLTELDISFDSTLLELINAYSEEQEREKAA